MARAGMQDAFKRLQDFKRVASDGAAFSVCLTRHTEAALAKLLMRSALYYLRTRSA
jgi:hypothetical protein